MDEKFKAAGIKAECFLCSTDEKASDLVVYNKATGQLDFGCCGEEHGEEVMVSKAAQLDEIYKAAKAGMTVMDEVRHLRSAEANDEAGAQHQTTKTKTRAKARAKPKATTKAVTVDGGKGIILFDTSSDTTASKPLADLKISPAVQNSSSAASKGTPRSDRRAWLLREMKLSRASGYVEAATTHLTSARELLKGF